MNTCPKQAVSLHYARKCEVIRVYHIPLAWEVRRLLHFVSKQRKRALRHVDKTPQCCYIWQYSKPWIHEVRQNKTSYCYNLSAAATQEHKHTIFDLLKLSESAQWNAPEQHNQACLSNDMRESIFIKKCQWLLEMQALVVSTCSHSHWRNPFHCVCPRSHLTVIILRWIFYTRAVVIFHNLSLRCLWCLWWKIKYTLKMHTENGLLYAQAFLSETIYRIYKVGRGKSILITPQWNCIEQKTTTTNEYVAM